MLSELFADSLLIAQLLLGESGMNTDDTRVIEVDRVAELIKHSQYPPHSPLQVTTDIFFNHARSRPTSATATRFDPELCQHSSTSVRLLHSLRDEMTALIQSIGNRSTRKSVISHAPLQSSPAIAIFFSQPRASD